MSSPRPQTSTSRSWLRVLIVGAALVVLVAVAAGTWYLSVSYTHLTLPTILRV